MDESFNLKAPRGKKKKRIAGRGRAARRGAKVGRGDKGQNSRSSGGVAPGFEGGQMPLYRRLARRGFNNDRFRKEYEIVNIGDVSAHFSDGDVVDAAALKAKKLVRSKGRYIKVLGSGELDKKITLTVDAVSRSAREKVEKAGGTITQDQKVISDDE